MSLFLQSAFDAIIVFPLGFLPSCINLFTQDSEFHWFHLFGGSSLGDLNWCWQSEISVHALVLFCQNQTSPLGTSSSCEPPTNLTFPSCHIFLDINEANTTPNIPGWRWPFWESVLTCISMHQAHANLPAYSLQQSTASILWSLWKIFSFLKIWVAHKSQTHPR